MCPAAERGLESKLLFQGRQTFDFGKKNSSCCHRCSLGPQRRKPPGDQIRIYKVHHAGEVWEILSRKCRLPGAVGSGDDDTTGRLRTAQH